MHAARPEAEAEIRRREGGTGRDRGTDRGREGAGGGDEGGDKPDGDADAADATPEEPDPELAPEPKDGEDEGDDERQRRQLPHRQHRINSAPPVALFKESIFETVRDLIDLVDDAALAEMRSLPRAPRSDLARDQGWSVRRPARTQERLSLSRWALTRKRLRPKLQR